ncbi:MAG: LpqB family beta-propeller domain-containing protein [Ornithinimicrobium sp.]|jgi:hypothetical protein|uniref:LpqB family beta-propeller domain-containing protein n=1 Tax=Ornithinimicrobium sp. TaxID=1977084 RepID=UPI0017C0DA57|nr:GerMN domain-containing protein [Actinomycetota bacterium]
MTSPPRVLCRLVVALLVGLLTLTACTGLPTDRSPRPGEAVLGQPRQLVQAQPDPPVPGASPQQVVRGFLLASVGFADGYEVARTHLTEGLSESWVPTDHVLVLDGEPDYEAVDEGEIEVSALARGELDGDGLLREFPAETTRAGSFSLTLVQGEWRIESFPEEFGLWLSASDFERQFRTASIGYGAGTQDVLVPDVRYFARDDGLPTALARGVLDPVPDYLAGAVVTAPDDQTELIAGSVPVDAASGVATVNLRAPGLGEDPEMMRLLWAQLVYALTQAGGVRSVDLQLNGTPVQVPGLRSPVASVTDLGYRDVDPAVEVAVLRVREELTPVDATNYALDNLSAARADDLDLPRPSVRWEALATNAGLDEFAAISRDHATLWRWRGDQEVSREEIGTDLSPPAFDRTGALWVAGQSATGPRVWVLDRGDPLDAVARRVQTPWLQAGTLVQDLRLAPDAQRGVVLLQDESSGRQSVGVVGVVRDRDGTALALTEPRPVARDLETVSTVAWATSTSLAVLGMAAQEEILTPYQVPLNGWIGELPAESSSQQLRAVPDGEGAELFLVTTDGKIFNRSGGGWYSYRNGDALIVPVG